MSRALTGLAIRCQGRACCLPRSVPVIDSGGRRLAVLAQPCWPRRRAPSARPRRLLPRARSGGGALGQKLGGVPLACDEPSIPAGAADDHPPEQVAQRSRLRGGRAARSPGPREPSRHRLFRCIADAPRPVGVAELTGYVRLHHNAVRLHLAVPRDAGLVTEEADAGPVPAGPACCTACIPRRRAAGTPRGPRLARRRARPGRPGQAGGTPGRQHGHRRAAELTARLTRTTIWSRRWRVAASARPAPSAVGG